MIGNIFNLAYDAHKDSEKELELYIKFEAYITPLVRYRFNLPRFELKYRDMVSKDIQDFISKEEQLFKDN